MCQYKPTALRTLWLLHPITNILFASSFFVQKDKQHCFRLCLLQLCCFWLFSSQFFYRYLTLCFPFPHNLLIPGAAKFCSAGRKHLSQIKLCCLTRGWNICVCEMSVQGKYPTWVILTALSLKAATPPWWGSKMLRLVQKAAKLNCQQVLLVSSGFRKQAIHLSNQN